MKTKKDIVRDVELYLEVFKQQAIEERKRYYLEERPFYRELRFKDFLSYRDKYHLMRNILGYDTKKEDLKIVIYA